MNRDQSGDELPREHELPNGGLVVAKEFCREVRHAVTVDPVDRDLYKLLVHILAEAGERVRGTFAANVATAFDTLPAAMRGLRDIERGVAEIGDRSYGMSITLNAAEAIEAHRDRDPLRLAAVGCSGSKYEDDGLMPAMERYKGAYWSNKGGYGELRDDWRVLSAEHDVLHPEKPIEYYERTPDDWRGVPVDSDARLPSGEPVDTRLDLWALNVHEGLAAWIAEATDDVDPRDVELEVLLGQQYREPLEKRGVFDALRTPGELTVSFPFQEVEQAQGGMFEQIGWMSDEIAAAEVATDGGEPRGE
ncbi:DUF6884 domain-containing protein [Halorubrum sp. CBA1229]|uniref:DUF6884 domain-containing protein n=1 Tax=Halorubrum sp. CBA1229 TaxID=1853699 RepID=UPI000F40973B|nr:DUF6884 domain-containing protein [Halorubrum sp. CBA1229]QKY16416.1 hypothetical protein Hrr1229_005810 [Halorubrum sp. CBA1229]